MSWKTKQSSNSIPPFLVFNSCCDMFLNHVMIELKQWSNNSRLIIKSSLIMMIPCYTIACYTIFDPRQRTKKKCRRVKAALKAIKNVAQFLPQTSIGICRSSQCLKILKKSHSTFTMFTFWLKMPKNSQFQFGGIFEKFKCDILSNFQTMWSFFRCCQNSFWSEFYSDTHILKVFKSWTCNKITHCFNWS